MLRAGKRQIGLNQDDWRKGRDREKGIGVRLSISTPGSVDEIAKRADTRGVGRRVPNIVFNLAFESLTYTDEEEFMTTRSAVIAPATKVAVAQAAYKAYETKDRAALEAIIADDFHFTSPLDNRIDRATYFRRCWPNSEWIAGFDFIDVVTDGDRVSVTYEARKTDGGRFRNTEVLTIRDDQIVDVEVYFGWSLPHKAPQGGFVDPPPQQS